MSDQIIQLNQDLIHTELKDLVKNSVEETLNSLLDAEADRLVNAERYARDEERTGYRAGHYDRSLTTAAGKVNLRMPKLKGVTFETAIIERYRRRETSVEEALIEMYLAGVSVRRVEDWICRCAESACPVFWKSPVRIEEITIPEVSIAAEPSSRRR